jgi:rhamnosyltransferase
MTLIVDTSSAPPRSATATPFDRSTPALREPATSTDTVAAIVVTYHPDDNSLLNLRDLFPQVDHLIVVDNCSTREELAPLAAAAAALPFELIENPANLGVATALNTGIRRAIDLGADWILLFDQDSRVTPGFTATMLEAFRTSPLQERLGLLVPRYADLRHGNILAPVRLPDGTLAVTMTSGSLFRTRTLIEHGLFLDGLFIDAVDHEHCLRLRRAGLILAECQEATLLHSPATPQQFRLGGKLLFEITHYGPVRRYYQQRNRVLMARIYLRHFPGYCLQLMLTSLKDLVKIVFFEPRKLAKLKYFALGLRDGLLGRVGPLAS